MTAQQEVRFACDRCGHEAIIPLANAPVIQRLTAPEDWLTYWLTDTTLAPRHLCSVCRVEYDDFMSTPPKSPAAAPKNVAG